MGHQYFRTQIMPHIGSLTHKSNSLFFNIHGSNINNFCLYYSLHIKSLPPSFDWGIGKGEKGN